MTVRSLTRESRRASMSASGMPHRPKPPTAISWPSCATPARAAAALGKILFIAGVRGVESARLSARALPRMVAGRTTTMDAAALQATLDRLAAECVKRLGLRVESVEPGKVTLSLPVSADIVHAGGV